MAINHAFIYIKAASNTELVRKMVDATLKKLGIIIDNQGETHCNDIILNDLWILDVDREALHYGLSIYWYCVQFNKSVLPWKKFNADVIGIDENPKKCNKNSIRNMIYTNYKELGIKSIPTEKNNSIYGSLSAIHALRDRLQWLAAVEGNGVIYEDSRYNHINGNELGSYIYVENDVFGRELVDKSGPNGKALVERFIRNVHLNTIQPPGNVLHRCVGMNSDEVIEFVKTEQQNFVDSTAVQFDKCMRNTSPLRVTEEPKAEEVFVDMQFRDDNSEVSEWTRISDIYLEPMDGKLLPVEPKIEHFIQGLSKKCNVLAAFASLCTHPKILENLFVSKEVRRDGRYTFQFYQWDKWQKVEIDDYIPTKDGSIYYCRSPTEHWWPLLLEKAYAKFYKSYSNIHKGLMNETFHDLTGLPVNTYVLKETFVAQGAIPDYRMSDFWVDVGEKLRQGHHIMSLILHSDMISSATAEKDHIYWDIGLEFGHGYVVLDIVTDSEDGIEQIEMDKVTLMLHNPFQNLRYRKRKDQDTNLSDNSTYCPADRVFPVLLVDILQICSTIVMGHITLVEQDPYLLGTSWTEDTAGGPPTSVAWRTNPIFIVENTSNKDITTMALIKQADSRQQVITLNSDTPTCGIAYVQCGFTVVRDIWNGHENNIKTHFLTKNLFEIAHKGIFMNLREVCDKITFPANTISYLVPSTIKKNTIKENILIALYNPVGNTDISFSHMNVDVDIKYPCHANIELKLNVKEYIDVVVYKPTQLHILLVQENDNSVKDSTDLICDTYVAMMVFNNKNEKIASMNSGNNYKENGLVFNVEKAGRYAILMMCLKGLSTACSLFVTGSPEARVTLCTHRNMMMEDMNMMKRREEKERENKYAQVKKVKDMAMSEGETFNIGDRKRRIQQEANQADENERQRRLNEETSEHHRKREQEKREKQKQLDEAAAERHRKRKEKSNEQKRLCEEAAERRRALEYEEKIQQEANQSAENERQRHLNEEASERRRKREREKMEKQKQLEEEAAERRKNRIEEKIRKAHKMEQQKLNKCKNENKILKPIVKSLLPNVPQLPRINIKQVDNGDNHSSDNISNRNGRPIVLPHSRRSTLFSSESLPVINTPQKPKFGFGSSEPRKTGFYKAYYVCR